MINKKLNISFLDYLESKEYSLQEGILDYPRKIFRGIGGAISGFTFGKGYEDPRDSLEQFYYLIRQDFKKFINNLSLITKNLAALQKQLNAKTEKLKKMPDSDPKKLELEKELEELERKYEAAGKAAIPQNKINDIHQQLLNGYKGVVWKMFRRYEEIKNAPKVEINPSVEPNFQQEKSRDEDFEKSKQQRKVRMENWANNFNVFVDYMIQELAREPRNFYSKEKFPFSTMIAIRRILTFIPLVLNISFEELNLAKGNDGGAKKKLRPHYYFADLIYKFSEIFSKYNCNFEDIGYVQKLRNCVASFDREYTIQTITELKRTYQEWKDFINALREIANVINYFCQEHSEDICVQKGNKDGHNLYINVEESKSNISFSNWLLMKESNYYKL
jgi:hypothetical protein